MISDKERREVAARMRKIMRDDPHGWLDMMVAKAVVDVMGEGVTVGETLADLIDRPTCKYVSLGNRRFGCSWCGHVVKLDYDVPVANEAHMPFNYCPNCSAEVVKCDE